MDDEDRYTRITLRIPKELHRNLSEAADQTSKSLNAEIVGRLEQSFSGDPGVLQRSLRMQETLTRTMAQFVISAVEIAGPQKGVTSDVFQLMKETALQVKAGEEVVYGEPFLRLFKMLHAVVQAPDAHDLGTFVSKALDDEPGDAGAAIEGKPATLPRRRRRIPPPNE